MGIMICEVHGRSGFVETCSHVARQIDDRQAPQGRRFKILPDLFICDACFDALGFKPCISLADMPLEKRIDVTDGRWEAFHVAYDAIENRRAYCLKCVSELEGGTA